MIMIRSVVRPEKVDAVLAALMEAGFPAVTKMSVVGRGKQRGIKIGEITYDVAILTNLTHEHLEFHGTFEAYRAAKRSLFDRLAADHSDRTYGMSEFAYC